MKDLIKLIIINKYITIEEMAVKYDVNKKTIKRDIDFLKSNNILKREGSKKTGHWKLIKNKK